MVFQPSSYLEKLPTTTEGVERQRLEALWQRARHSALDLLMMQVRGLSAWTVRQLWRWRRCCRHVSG